MTSTEATHLLNDGNDMTRRIRRSYILGFLSLLLAASLVFFFTLHPSTSNSSPAAAAEHEEDVDHPVVAPRQLHTPELEQIDFCDASVKQESGFIQLDNSPEDHYFYWFFESRDSPSTDPLVLWLTGGPGCSSIMALLGENGPCTVSPDGMTTRPNPHSWINHANMLWVDQPTGVGYSYGTTPQHTESQVGDNMWHFLNSWLNAHPSYRSRPFFIMGESYGGHYVPAVAHTIVTRNTDAYTPASAFIALSGIGIGNGLTSPYVQYQHATDLALNNAYNLSLVSPTSYAAMLNATDTCLALIQECNHPRAAQSTSKEVSSDACAQANNYCNTELVAPQLMESHRNPYDMRQECDLAVPGVACIDQANILTFLNLKETQKTLHVMTANTTASTVWQECNMQVNQDFAGDWMKNYAQYVPPLLENGIRVLIYAGDADLMCNWVGNEAWTKAMEWSGKDAFNALADPLPYHLENGTVVGTIRHARDLTFIRIYNAGHMVPMDQPIVSLEMVKTFFNNGAFEPLD